MEIALRQSEAQNRALLTAIPDLIMRISQDGIYRDFIEAKNIQLVVPFQNRIGKRVDDILPAPLAQQYREAIQKAVYTGLTQVFEYQLEIQGVSGEYEARVVASGSDEAILIVRDITERKQAEAALRSEQEKSERLLLNVLPRSIADQLKQNQGAIAHRFEEATILFADIVDFTKLAAHTPPTELVGLLNEIFSVFDHLAEQHGLEKIKTIGDAYMVVGGLPAPRPDHAAAIAEMALDMQQQINQFQVGESQPFSIRIGINTGPVVAGVIGLKKFIYDLWGDAVNVASRMESQGLTNSIQVTAATYDRLKDQYVLEERGPIQVKGKGEMTTYFLRGRKQIL
nr:adenylate/guanylate cyclase domain-containing protein [Leptolyngbya sp. 'hensonii']